MRSAATKRILHCLLLVVLLSSAALAQVSINANANLDGAAVNTAYSVNLFPAGGLAPYSFSVISGALPAGLTLTTAGVLSGTPTTATPPVVFTVLVLDSNGASATKTFTLPVSAAPLSLAPAAGTLPPGTVGQLYQRAFTASGGSGSYTYLLIPSALTNNLDIEKTTGLFYGTPKAAGTFSFSVVVIDSQNRTVSQAYSIAIQAAPVLAVAEPCTANLPALLPGAFYSAQLSATGGEVPYHFSATGLPVGLTVSAGGLISGVLSPDSFFEGPLPVTVLDGTNTVASAICMITIATSESLIITNSSPLLPAIQGQSYSTHFSINQGFPLEFTSTTLPAGLNLDSLGTLSGTVTAAPGTYNFDVTVLVASEGSSTPSVTKTFQLVVIANPLTITTASPLTAFLDRFYSQTIAASETPVGNLQLVSGTLPPGLTLAGQKIIGTPLATGTYNFTLELDAPDGRQATKAFTLTVSPSVMDFVTSSLPVGVVGASYLDILQQGPSGGSPSLWSTASLLPAGITLAGDGVFSGIPTAAGTSTLTVVLNGDSDSSTSRDLALRIRGQALTISTPSVPIGRPGVSYNSPQFTAIGGSGGGYFFNFGSGTLPSGISLSSFGNLSGITNQTGSFPFSVIVSDSDGSTASRGYTLIISAPLAQTTLSLPSGVVNTPYPNTPLTATGGIGTYTWSRFSGALPAGLSLSAAGVISGTPTAAGTATFTARVTDSVGQTADVEYQITVIAQLVITTASLPGGVVGTAYPVTTLAASGGTSPFAWSILSGALPAGLNLSSAGVITGIPTATGPSNVTIKVTDGSSQTATKAFAVTVVGALTQTAQTLPNGIVSTPYAGATLQATGGTGSYSWLIVSGSLPAGLNLSSAGVISGTPTTANTFNFTARVTDTGSLTADAVYQIVVIPQLTITTATLPGGVVGTAYPNTTLATSGGTSPFAWSILSGSLPAGLTLSAGGVIAGTPTTAGSPSVTIKVTDNGGQTATRAYTITVVGALTGNPQTLPNGVVNVVYPGATLTASGGTGTLSWSLASGSVLPPGLTLSSTGAISGTPTTAGTYPFTAHVADSASQSANASYQIIVAAALSITTATLPGGVVGTAYPSTTLATAGGTSPFTWTTLSGSLPAGLTLSSGGVITGTPTTAGTSNVTIKVTDNGGQTATKAYTVTVVGALTQNSQTLPNGIVNTVYPGATLTAAGGTLPLVWSLTSGSVLPAGLTLSSLGAISGTPTTAGTFTFTAHVADSGSQTANASYQIIVLPQLTITTSSLPGGTVGAAYPATTLVATGGTLPYTWSILSGSLPNGLQLSAAGVVSGTTTTAGTFNVTIKVADGGTQTATKAYQIVVGTVLTQTSQTLPNGNVGTVYPGATLTASGGAGSNTWSITSGALPGGLSLSAAGAISGTPTAAGTFIFTAHVVDSASQSADAQYQILVLTPLTITTASLPAGTTHTAYPSTTLGVSGGTSPFTWSVQSGSLPTGLALSSSGVITGTPTATGTYNFTIQVSDNGNQTATKAYQVVITIGSGTQLTPTALTLPNGIVTTVYAGATLAATGGVTPYSWSLVMGALPPGLNLDSSGAIGGTPTSSGTYGFTALVTDSGSQTATATYQIVVLPKLTITTQNLPNGAVSAAYSSAVAVVGGTTPYTWSIASGQLPTGLTLSSTGGGISGTPSANGTYTVTIQVADSGGQTTSMVYQIVIAAGLTANPQTLPDGIVNTVYAGATLTASGGSGVTWILQSGSLPPGLNLNSGGGISGTPTLDGTYIFTAQVSQIGAGSATATYQIIVIAPLTIVTQSLPSGATAVAYPSTTLAAAGGTSPYTWTVTSGSLPPGLTLPGSGTITGTPTSSGTYNFTIGVSDSRSQTATKALQIVITGTLTANPQTLPSGLVGAVYSGATLTASGGSLPYSWALGGSTTLPPGLTLSSNGLISGTPTAEGTFAFTATVTDGAMHFASAQYQIVVFSQFSITTQTLPSGAVNTVYPSTALTTTGGTAPYTFFVSQGSLPPGLSLSSGSGTITGTPTALGTYPFTVQVFDSRQQTASAGLQIIVNSTLQALPATLPTSLVTATYPGATLGATGGSPPYTWTVISGSLPPGLTLGSGGTIGGVATAAGTYSFMAQVSDAAGRTASGSYQIVIIPVLTALPQALPAGNIDVVYPGATLTASGGVAPYSWNLSSGTLPPGLTLSSGGAISGTPTTLGTFTFSAQVMDHQEATSTASYQIVVNPPALRILTTALPGGTAGSPYPAASLAATGGVAPYSWSISAGSLPPGITLSSAGLFSGIPSSAGTLSFTVKVTDSANNTATAALQIAIAQGPVENTLNVTPTSIPGGTIGVAYAPVQFGVNTTGAFRFTAAGSVPPGLSLTSSGLLSGTPTQTGAFTFSVNATGLNGNGSVTLALRITGPISVSPGTVGPLSANKPSQTQFTATGGMPPYIFSGCVVPGLILSSTGLLSGTPTTTGVFNCTVTATDSYGAIATTTVVITVVAGLTIGPFTPTPGFVSQPYAPVTLTATGGKTPYIWSVGSGSLPPGLTLSSGGVLSGTPTTGGNFTFTVLVTDAAGLTGQTPVSITITDAPVVSGAVTDGVVNVAYVPATFTATGGTRPYTFSTTGSLPPGLTLSSVGVLSGTPSQAGTFVFNVVATDANKLAGTAQFTIKVTGQGLTIVTPTQQPVVPLPGGTTGSGYNQTFTTVGGVPPLVWSISAGSLPSGVTLSTGGVLSGTPTEDGTFNITIQVTDSGQPPATASQSYSLVVTLPGVSGFAIQGLPATVDPTQQPPFRVVLGTAFPVLLSGTLTVTADDPNVKFSNGATSIPFTIPTGQTTAVFTNPAMLMSTGTVGTAIVVAATLRAPVGGVNGGGTVDVTPPSSSASTAVNTGPPVITSVTASNVSGTVTLLIQGFATTRQMTQAKFHFTPSGTSNVQTTDFTVDVNSAFTTWYQSTASKAVGSLFSYTQPFTIQGPLTGGSVSVTLINDKGTSNSITAQF